MKSLRPAVCGEFHQFGVEMLGGTSPAADAEVIGLANEHLLDAGGQASGAGAQLHRVSRVPRPSTTRRSRSTFASCKDQLCETCLSRLETNPMRILDCKSPVCSADRQGRARWCWTIICDDCKEHFDGSARPGWTRVGIAYTVNPRIVRGTRLLHQARCLSSSPPRSALRARSAAAAGTTVWWKNWAARKPRASASPWGWNGCCYCWTAQENELPAPRPCELYIASIGDAANIKAGELCARLRSEGFYVECDTMERSVKAQMKYANKIGAKMSMVLGDSELESGKAALKDMDTGESAEVSLGDELTQRLYDAGLARATSALTDQIGDAQLLNLLGQDPISE